MSILQRLRRLIPRTRRGRWRVFFYGTVVMIPALDMLYVQWLRHIPLGRDTTYVDAPLAPDGYPDYVAYLNNELGKGVTPENNAAVPLLKLILSPEEKSVTYQRICAAWGLPPDTTPALYKSDWTLMREKAGDKSDEEVQKQFMAYSETFWFKFKMGAWPGTGNLLAEEWMALSGPALAAAHEAIARPKYFVPITEFDGTPARYLHESDATFSFGSYQISGFAQAFMVRAGARARMGNPAGACEDILDTYRIAYLRFPSMGDWGYLTPAQTILAFVNELPAANARQLLHDLPSVPPPDHPDLRAKVRRMEALENLQYAAVHGIIQGWKRETQDPLVDVNAYYFAQPWYAPLTGLLVPIPYGRAARDVNGWFDDAEAIPRVPEAAKEADARALEDRFKSAQDTGIGYRMAIRLVRDEFFEYGDVDRVRSTDDLARIALALRVYHGEHGSYPESLDALKGDLLETIPVSRETGTPLRYERQAEGYAIYRNSLKKPVLRATSPDTMLEF